MGTFSIFTVKKQNNNKKPVPTIAEYYSRLARRISLLMLALLFILITFVIFCFTFYSEHISIENLRYMIKFVEFNSSPVAAHGTVIEYDNGDNARGQIIRGDLAVVDINGVRIYDIKGKRVQNVNKHYTNPVTAVNGKNLIVYENMGNELKVYSSYSELHSETFKYPIKAIDSDKSGRYAILTSADGFTSGVEVYNSNFLKIFHRYFVSENAISMSLAEDGKTLAVITMSNTSSGEYKTTFYIFDVENDAQVLYTESYINESPRSVYYSGNDRILILTGSHLRIYDTAGNLVSDIMLDKNNIKSFKFSQNYAIIITGRSDLSNSVRMDIYDTNGNSVATRDYSENLLYLQLIDDYAYVYISGKLNILNLIGGTADIERDIGPDLISINNDKDNEQLVLFMQGQAVIYDKEIFNTNYNWTGDES